MTLIGDEVVLYYNYVQTVHLLMLILKRESEVYTIYIDSTN